MCAYRGQRRPAQGLTFASGPCLVRLLTGASADNSWWGQFAFLPACLLLSMCRSRKQGPARTHHRSPWASFAQGLITFWQR